MTDKNTFISSEYEMKGTLANKQNDYSQEWGRGRKVGTLKVSQSPC